MRARLLLAATTLLAAGSAPATEGWQDRLDSWRERRLTSLESETGWLTLIGLYRVEPGTTLIVGSAEGSDVRIPVGPRLSGRLDFTREPYRFVAEPGAEVLSDGQVVSEIGLVDDKEGPATVLEIGRVSLFLIERAGIHFVRVRDPQAEARAGFVGIESYPDDPAWRFDARFEEASEGRTIQVANIVGVVEESPSWGDLVFEVDGVERRLAVLAEPDAERFFVIFADETNEAETYGAGRYLYTDGPGDDGTTELDFNRAYNPPCAFTAYATCPLPPRSNDLPLRVEAGEKRYALDH